MNETKKINHNLVGYNRALVFKQDLSTKDLYILDKLYRKLKKYMRTAAKIEDIDKLKEVDKRVRKLEYKLQEAWKFKRDKSHHKYWYRVPGCTCPIYDNDELLGIDMERISPNCPIHFEGN